MSGKLQPGSARHMFRLFALAVAAVCITTTAHAQFRSPQVPVSGTGLQGLMAAQGQLIDVATQQRAARDFAGLNVGNPAPLAFGTRHMGGAGWTLALHDFHSPVPALRTILPGGSLPGWSSTVGFRTSPDRLVVNLFDSANTLQGTSTYVGVEMFSQGFAVDGTALGTVYSDDARNAGQPRLLLFRGTGAHVSDVWLCVEGDGDGDFDDAVFLLEFFAPTRTTSVPWGQVKRRFR